MALSTSQISTFSAAMADWLLDVESEAVEALNGRNDQGGTRQGMFIEPPKYEGGVLSGAIANSAFHSFWVHEGRPKGKQPPLKPLKGWALRKLGDEGAAYPVARKIARKGTVGTPFLREPAERLAPELPRPLADAAARAAAEAFPAQTV